MEDVKGTLKDMCRIMLERPDLRTSKVTRNETKTDGKWKEEQCSKQMRWT